LEKTVNALADSWLQSPRHETGNLQEESLMRTLELIFKSADDKTKTISINYASGNLVGADVQKKMQQITELGMFDNNGVNPYQTPIAAQYRRTEIDKLYDTRAN
jgi:hypothetical protein